MVSASITALAFGIERVALFDDGCGRRISFWFGGGIAVALDDLLAGNRRDQRLADLVVGDRLLELDDQDRAAREVDAERDALAAGRRRGRR